MNVTRLITVQDNKHKKLMWMEVHSVKPKSQAGNTWVKDIMARYSARDVKNLHIWPEMSEEGLGSGEGAAEVTEYLFLGIHPQF